MTLRAAGQKVPEKLSLPYGIGAPITMNMQYAQMVLAHEKAHRERAHAEYLTSPARQAPNQTRNAGDNSAH